MATQTDMSPSEYPFAITPSDSAELPLHRSISISTAGNVKVTRLDGTTDTLALPAGVIPMRIRVLWSTGTTASGFVGYR